MDSTLLYTKYFPIPFDNPICGWGHSQKLLKRYYASYYIYNIYIILHIYICLLSVRSFIKSGRDYTKYSKMKRIETGFPYPVIKDNSG